MTRTLVCGALGDRAPEWDALVDAHRPTPFLRSAWLDAAATPDTRTVLVLADDGRLLGGFPLEIAPDRIARVAGAELAPDHVDLVCAPDDAAVVGTAVVDWWRRGRLRGVDLHGVVAASRIGQALGSAAVDSHESLAPWAALPASFEDYWSRRPGALRSTVERATRRLARSGFGHQRMGADDVDEAIEEYFRLHRLRFDGVSAVLPVRDRFERAVRSALGSGLLVAHRITDGSRSVALELWFESPTTTWFYQSGRDPDDRWRGVGSVLKARVIESAIDRGLHEVDFLRGDEQYKRDWTDAAREVRRLGTPAARSARARRLIRRRLGALRRRTGWPARPGLRSRGRRAPSSPSAPRRSTPERDGSSVRPREPPR